MWLKLVIIVLVILVLTSFAKEILDYRKRQYILPIPEKGAKFYLAVFQDGSALFIIGSAKPMDNVELAEKISDKLKEIDASIKQYIGRDIAEVKTMKATRSILRGFATVWADSSKWFKETLSEIPNDISALGSLVVGLFVRINWASIRIMSAQETLERNAAYAVLRPTHQKAQSDYADIIDNVSTIKIASKYPLVVLRLTDE